MSIWNVASLFLFIYYMSEYNWQVGSCSVSKYNSITEKSSDEQNKYLLLL